MLTYSCRAAGRLRCGGAAAEATGEMGGRAAGAAGAAGAAETTARGGAGGTGEQARPWHTHVGRGGPRVLDRATGR
mgnify:CR=1 FL=1